MDRRKLLLGLVAAGLFALTGSVDAQNQLKKGEGQADHKSHMMAEHFDKCAKACTSCMRECESCFHHCAHLVADGRKEHLTTVQTCSDCAEFCAAAARIVARRGPMANTICESCAKACDVCGAACEKFPTDKHMAACAKECRNCAQACREMIEHSKHAGQAEK
jgi:hypothetical protein